MSTSKIRRRVPRKVAPLAALVIALLGFGTALAVHDDNLFELGPAQGADILGDGVASNGPDWGDLFDASGNPVGPAGVAKAFVADDLSAKGATDRTTFGGAGGSNKNNDPMSVPDCAGFTPPLTGSACDTWHWDGGNNPPKDDLANIYAYATIPTAPATGTPPSHLNHLVLYTGIERLAPEGDSHIDVEFLQEPVSLDEALPCNDPGSDVVPCSFVGVRTVDDIIVSMDFLQGGAIGSVHIRRWSGSEYVQIGVAGGEGCTDANSDPGDDICAFNNGGDINGGPWPNFDRGGATITSLPAGAFTEIGVDISALLGGNEIPCISTVMAKTRSSDSFTAELKDFTPPKAFNICGASISIAPDDVNEVGQPHTFTVTVNKTIGNTTVAAPDGTIVNVTLTDANGAVHNISSDTCAAPGTVNGTCSVTFTSNTPGTVTGHAAADVAINGDTKHVETDGTGSNSGNAVKRFVEAKIAIGPDDTNSVGESHTFTVNVQQNDGLAAAQGGDGVTGFGPAPNGTQPSVTLTDSGGAINSISSNTCAGAGTVSGSCTVTFTSNTAGTVTGHATVTFSVSGVSLTRATDSTHGSTGDATKVFVAGSLTWFKNDNAGARQGGATFEVCRTHNLNTATGTFVAITPVCVTVLDDTDGTVGPGLDQDADAGEFKLTGLRLGRYTVDETVAPQGFEPDPAVVTVDLTVAAPNATISTAFVNNRPILKITGFGYTNAASGSPTAGIVSGTATYTVNLHNYGGAAATLSNSSLAVSVTGAGAGTVTCGGAAVPVNSPITGTVAAGGNLTPAFTLACTYSNLADGAVITATLNVKYTTNGLERTASGSPATISFTVQAD
jgi:prealbumin domain-containing protein